MFEVEYQILVCLVVSARFKKSKRCSVRKVKVSWKGCIFQLSCGYWHLNFLTERVKVVKIWSDNKISATCVNMRLVTYYVEVVKILKMLHTYHVL